MQNDNLNFGQAIEIMKNGFKVAREGWNGKGMWLCLGKGKTIKADEFWNENAKSFALEQDNQEVEVLQYIIMKTADNKILMGWNPNQIDMLSNDWGIVE